MVVRCISLVSRLRINLGKSVLLAINLANSIGCSAGSGPTQYLVLPQGVKDVMSLEGTMKHLVL